jgi:hypothetical protein
MDTVQIDCRVCFTPRSSFLIQSYISSFFASCFSSISSEISCRAAMRKLKSLEVRTVCILVTVAFDFFLEEGFRGEPFLFFRGSTLSPCSYLTSFSPNSSPSSPCSSEIETVFSDALSTLWTSSFFFAPLGTGVSHVVYGLSMSDISVGSAGIRRSAY